LPDRSLALAWRGGEWLLALTRRAHPHPAQVFLRTKIARILRPSELLVHSSYHECTAPNHRPFPAQRRGALDFLGSRMPTGPDLQAVVRDEDGWARSYSFVRRNGLRAEVRTFECPRNCTGSEAWRFC